MLHQAFRYLVVLLLVTLSSLASAKPVRIWCAGDDWLAVPEDTAVSLSWVQPLADSVSGNATWVYLAEKGGGIRSLLSGGQWQQILSDAGRGDILLLQLGSNERREDMPDSYLRPDSFAVVLSQLLVEADKAKLSVVLCTPVAGLTSSYAGVHYPCYGAYADVIRRVAAQKRVPLLDLEDVSFGWLQNSDEDRVSSCFLTDDRFYGLTPEGARLVADMARNLILKNKIKQLAKYIIKS